MPEIVILLVTTIRTVVIDLGKTPMNGVILVKAAEHKLITAPRFPSNSKCLLLHHLRRGMVCQSCQE
jgi:hypothetical protein